MTSILRDLRSDGVEVVLRDDGNLVLRNATPRHIQLASLFKTELLEGLAVHPIPEPYGFFYEIDVVYRLVPKTDQTARQLLRECDDAAAAGTLDEWRAKNGQIALATLLPLVQSSPDLSNVLRRIAGEPV